MKAGHWSLRPAFLPSGGRKADAKFPLRDKPVFSTTKTVMLDTSVTFYSEISTAIIGAWQRRRAYGQSQVARLLQKEQFSGAGSGTGSIFPYGSFFPRTEPPR
jgi:hypothetical protein